MKNDAIHRLLSQLLKSDPALALDAEDAVFEHAKVHDVDAVTALGLLVRSGIRRLRTARKYAASEKGERAQRRYVRRREAGLVRRRAPSRVKSARRQARA